LTGFIKAVGYTVNQPLSEFEQMPFTITVPYMRVEAYSEKTGLSVETIRGMIRRNQIASCMVGRHRMVDLVAEFKAAVEKSEAA
jgi:excisionase family DNA binding protein